MPAVGADTLNLDARNGMLLEELLLAAGVLLQLRAGQSFEQDRVVRRVAHLASHGVGRGPLAVILLHQTAARRARQVFVEGIVATAEGRDRGVGLQLAAVPGVVPRRITHRRVAVAVRGVGLRVVTARILVRRAENQRAAQFVDTDAVAAVPVEVARHPRLVGSARCDVGFGRIVGHPIVGQAVGRRNALPLPRHAVEVDRERAQTVGVDFGPCGQRRLGRCDLGDRPSRRQHVAGIGGRAAVLVDAHGIRPVGREIGLGRIDTLLLLGHLQRRIDRLVTGHRRAVEIVVIVHTQLHDGDLGRCLARVGRADMDGEDRRAVVALRGPLRSPQHHAACPFVAPREPLAGIRLAVGHRVVVDVAHVGRVVDRRLAAGRGILDARLGQFADDLGVGLQPRLRNGKGLDGAVLGRHGQHARTAVLRVGRRHDLHGPHPRRRHGARPRIGERFVDDGLADRGPRHVALGAPRVAALLEGHHLHDTHIGHLAVDGRAVGREPDFGGRQGDAGSRIDAQFPGILVTSRKERRRRQERYDSCFHLL